MTWSLLFSILIGLIGIDLLVIVHELGHYLSAKTFKVYVEKVQLGLGPSFMTKVGKTGTLYSFGAIPYGAFSKLDSYSMEQSHPLKKIVIYISGPAFNIVFYILCYTLYLLMLKTNIGTSLKLASQQCFSELKMFYYAIGDMITGQSKIGDTLSGFLKASENIGAITKAGFNSGFAVGVETALWLSASVSVSLAFANLIPIPALDGGLILISLIELITGHKFSEKFQIITQCIGLFIIFVLFPLARMFF